jgi:hypothetical protein
MEPGEPPPGGAVTFDVEPTAPPPGGKPSEPGSAPPPGSNFSEDLGPVGGASVRMICMARGLTSSASTQGQLLLDTDISHARARRADTRMPCLRASDSQDGSWWDAAMNLTICGK